MTKRTNTLVERVSQEHLELYMARAITAKQFAEIYKVNDVYVYQTFKRPPLPPKQSTPTKSELSAARKLYRLKLSLTTTAKLAAEATYTSLRTMYRYKAKAKQMQEADLI
jgi:hypothetical protein